MTRGHRLVSMEWPGAQCVCGWHTVLQQPTTWGMRAAADELLDRYNEHRRGQPTRRIMQQVDDRDDSE